MSAAMHDDKQEQMRLLSHSPLTLYWWWSFTITPHMPSSVFCSLAATQRKWISVTASQCTKSGLSFIAAEKREGCG